MKKNLGVISILLLWYCQASPHFNQSRESWKSKIPSAFTNFQSWETNIFHHLPVLSSRRKDIQNPPKLHVYMYIYNCTYMFNGEVRLNLKSLFLFAFEPKTELYLLRGFVASSLDGLDRRWIANQCFSSPFPPFDRMLLLKMLWIIEYIISSLLLTHGTMP